ncbi:MAG: VWA domain-containing protein [Planctomyces sp.]|nr:VWA domain-containing protein [Planctomyces sp.]
MLRRTVALFGFLVASWATCGWAQVVLITSQPVPLPRPIPRPVPQPQAEYSIRELNVDARITDQVARVQVAQTFVNNGSSPIEAQFLFPLPYDGAIDRLTLLVDGKEYPAQLLSKEEARRRYEQIVRSNKDPALLEWMGQGMFQTSVFPIPPGAERKVVIEYKQLLRKYQSLTEILFPLATARFTSKPLEKLNLRFAIESGVEIKSLYSPTHPVNIQRPDGKHAIVTFERAGEVPASDFRLFFDVQPGELGTSLLSHRPTEGEEGYFLLLTSPQIPAGNEAPPARTIVFVVDKSGSMSGPKIEQARNALKTVLNGLREGDLFNIVAYDSAVESFRPELERFTAETRQAAANYVDGLYAGGGTNIHGALTTALGQLKDDKRPSYVLFLTDGLPTVGETGEAKIAAASKDANKVRARILSFGVGYDVNSRLLDRISRDNSGASEYVRPDEDIETSVGRVASRISSPLMTDVQVTFEFDGPWSGPAPVSRVYPAGSFDLFAGEQVVVVGRYRASGAAKARIAGKINGEPKSFDFPVEFAAKSGDASLAFVESLWAARRIGEIIDELDLNGHNQELVNELVTLSTQYGILTPYTSFLADESMRPGLASRENRDLADHAVRELLSQSGGAAGVAQRSSKQDFKAANRPLSSGGFAGRSSGPAAPAASPAYIDAATDRLVVVESVRNVGSKALYRRGRIVVTPETAELDVEKDTAKFTVVERYSDDYFKLVAANSADENQLLSSQSADEELLIQLRGQAYLIK